MGLHAYIQCMADENPSKNSDGDTSVRVGIATWQRLKDRKSHPNESYDSVINDLLDIADEVEEGNGETTAATAD